MFSKQHFLPLWQVKAIKIIFSTFLISAVLYASAGFNFSRHYCLGILIEESFYELPQSCDETCSDKSEDMSLDCCKNEIISIAAISFQSLEDRKASHSYSATSISILAPLEALANKLPFLNELNLVNRAIPPPLLCNKRQILFQSFLIQSEFLDN